MNMIKKIIAAALSASLLLILMCGCSDNSEDAQYEHLKTDIVGIWMNEGGPVVDTDNMFGDSLRFYEFTSDGDMYYHFVFMDEGMGVPGDSAMKTSTYYFDGNMLVNVAGSEEDGTIEKTGAIVEINGDTMTMSNNSGAQNYTKLSIEDATGYYLSYKDTALYEKQQALIDGTAAETDEGSETEAAADEASSESTETASETVSESTEE